MHQPYRRGEILTFLHLIGSSVDPSFDIHVTADNHETHTASRVHSFLRRNPHSTMHSIPPLA
jgi:hypothetical protein